MAVEPAVKMASGLLISSKIAALDSNKYHLIGHELGELKVNKGTWQGMYIQMTFYFGKLIFLDSQIVFPGNSILGNPRVLRGIVLRDLSSPVLMYEQ